MANPFPITIHVLSNIEAIPAAFQGIGAGTAWKRSGEGLCPTTDLKEEAEGEKAIWQIWYMAFLNILTECAHG